MAEDWGCNVDLFGGSNAAEKQSKSLTELVDILTKKNKNGPKINVQTTVEPENVKVVPFQRAGLSSKSTTKIGMIHAPKILKKKKAQTGSSVTNNNKILDETNVKRVTFEVEKLISREAAKDDREKARDRMLASLGAAPQKRDYVNYKDLKSTRATQKAEAKAQAELHHANSLSMTVIKKKKKNNKKK